MASLSRIPGRIRARISSVFRGFAARSAAIRRTRSMVISMAVLLSGLCALPGVAAAAVLINELDYDQPGSDRGEFIELKNTGPDSVSLDGYLVQLVNGGGSGVYRSIPLPALSLAAGDYFVICGDPGNVANCDFDASPDSNLIQNGAPDAVALLLGDALLDALSYEGDTVAPFTEGSGVGGGSSADSNSIARVGLSRLPDGADSDDNSADFSRVCISPGAANLDASTACDTAPGDTTPPLITATVSGTEGDNGWYISDVGVSWAVVDAESAVTASSGCEAVSLVEDTAAVTFTCEASSAGGSASDSITIRRDASAPLISLSSPADAAEYPLGSAVNAAWSVSDAQSGVASASGSSDDGAAIDTASPGAKTYSVSATDNAGNTATVAHGYRVIAAGDSTPPLISPTVTGSLGDNGWYTGDVRVSWSVSDGESAISASSGCDAVSLVEDSAAVTFTCEASSAGGTASESVTVKRDATPPSLALRAPADGAEYALDSVVLAEWSVSDTLSGVASSDAGTASGAAIDTASAGDKQYSLRAVDNAGNASQVTHAYRVLDASADLSIEIVDSADPVSPGDPLSYTLTVRNAGPQAAQNALLSQLLPDAVSFVSSNGCDEDPGAMSRCSLGDIPAGGERRISIAVTVDEAASAELRLAAEVTSDSADPQPQDNRASQATQLRIEPPPGELQRLTRAVASPLGDSEELLSGISASPGSRDLEITDNDGEQQIVGLRFTDLSIPPAAVIQRAWVQFSVDETDDVPSLFGIRGQASDHAPAFSGARDNLSERPLTAAHSSWVPDAWERVGDRGEAQRSSDLAAILQEIVARPGWASGNAVVLIIDGVGRRVAYSYDGARRAGMRHVPVLHVEYASDCGPGRPDSDGDGQRDSCDADDDGDGVADVDDALPLDPGESLDTDGDGVGNNADVDDDNDGVNDVDDDFPLDPTRGGDGAQRVEVRISAAADDAEQVGRRVALYSPDLDMVEEGGKAHLVALRFRNVSVPAGVTIVSASLQFSADERDSGDARLRIRGLAQADARPFSRRAGDIDKRPRTAARVAWQPPPWRRIGERAAAQRSADIAAIVQELVGQPGWRAGNAMAFVIDGRGRRVADAYDGSRGGAASLLIEYRDGAVPAASAPRISPDGGRYLDAVRVGLDCATPASRIHYSLDGSRPDRSAPRYSSAIRLQTDARLQAICYSEGYLPSALATADFVITSGPLGEMRFERRMQRYRDDAEERLGDARVRTGSDDLEMVDDHGTQQLTGLRFSDVTVPQGARITAAWVQFSADEADAVPTELWLRGEAVDDAALFRERVGNISGRATTAARVSWRPPAWRRVGDAGEAQRTADLSAVVQEIVDRPGWRSGNALALIVGGSGERVAESREAGEDSAPVLHIEYRAAP